MRLSDQSRDCDPNVVVQQIGRMNIMAISGGRVDAYEDGIEMKVGAGYYVRVFLAFDDTYTVQRVFKRSGKVTVKGQLEGIYFDEVGEQAYRASSFRSYDFGEVPA